TCGRPRSQNRCPLEGGMPGTEQTCAVEALAPSVLITLFAVALLAGGIDAIAGGGGLLTLPALLLAQVPPVNALATNKLQSSFGTFTSALSMRRKGLA